MSNTSTHSSTRRLNEGGICIALALVLSYLKIPIGLSFGGFGGSITLVMVPLILFAVRYGAPWGILAGVAFGTLKYFFAEGFAVSWVQHGVEHGRRHGHAHEFLGHILRVDRHARDEVDDKAAEAADERGERELGIVVALHAEKARKADRAVGDGIVEDDVYNGTYMLPNTILAIVICALLMKPAAKLPSAE